MNKYFKNFILCGDINQYCLLCKESFYLITDIEKHIRWEKHRKIIKQQTYLPRYQKDLIYKVENYYYCEICNVVKWNISSLKQHVKTEEHVLLKNEPEAKTKKPAGLYDSGYVIIDKVILNKVQWNSIIDNKCFVCNVDVANVDEHTTMQEHTIKLIQAETTYTDNRFYRKTNEETYHCFACKKIYSSSNFEEHFENCVNNDEVEIKKLRDSKSGCNVEEITKDISRMEQLEKELVNTLQEFYIIDETNNVAFCMYCRSSIAIDFKTMIEHMRYDHDAKATKYDSSSEESVAEEVVYAEFSDYGKRRALLAKYGRKKNIKLNAKGNKGYCMVCDKFLPACKKNFKEHCKGVTHRGHLEIQGSKKPKQRDTLLTYNYQPISSFINKLQYSPEIQSLFINDTFSVDKHSFLLLYSITKSRYNTKTKCFACDEVIEEKDELKHCLTPKHINNFTAAEVVLRDNEFVRQIRPNLFHCGICNTLLPFSDVLETHLRTARHVELREEKGKVEKVYTYWKGFNPSVIDIPVEEEDVCRGYGTFLAVSPALFYTDLDRCESDETSENDCLNCNITYLQNTEEQIALPLGGVVFCVSEVSLNICDAGNEETCETFLVFSRAGNVRSSIAVFTDSGDWLFSGKPLARLPRLHNKKKHLDDLTKRLGLGI